MKNPIYIKDLNLEVQQFNDDQEAERSDEFQNTKKNHKIYVSDKFSTIDKLISDFKQKYKEYEDNTRGYGIVIHNDGFLYFIGHDY